MSDPWPRGTKRVRQACTSCRRKKTRCPGEKPICSFCLRLNQACKYDEDLPSDTSPPPYQYNGLTAGDLAARLAQIESKLSELSRAQSSLTHESPFQDLSQPFMMPALSIGYPNGSQVPQNYIAGPQVDPNLPNFEWGQAICVADLPKATLDRLVDDYFRYSHNQLYSFFHEDSFRLRIASEIIPEYLLEAVIVSSLRFSTDPYFEDDLFFLNKRKVTADAFARKSWKTISSRFVDGDDDCSVAVVQAVTLLAIYEFIEGRQRNAWVKIGIAAKFAQDLRLMFEPASSLPFSEQEESRRAFWSIYLLDKLMTCGRARPPVFADGSVIVQLPCTESAFKQNRWEDSEELEAVIIISAILSRCSQYSIHTRRDNHRVPPWDINSEYTSINSSLLYLESHVNWQQPIREVIKASTADMEFDASSAELMVVSQALHHLCYCILNHYFLLRHMMGPSATTTMLPPSFLINALQIGLHHAQEFNRVLKLALEAGCMVNASFLSYACLIVATIHAVYRHSDNTFVREQAIKDVDFSRSFLQRQAQHWPNSAIIVNQFDEFGRHSAAYKCLISDCFEIVNVSAVDANRMYSLIDYSTLSARKDVAVWPSSHAGATEPFWSTEIRGPT